MKKTILRFSATAAVACLLFACQKEMSAGSETGLEAARIASAASLVTPPPCGQMRTQTQGGWGAAPEGNNSAAYLQANFQAAFGGSLTVGCYPNNFYVELTSAQAVNNLLPTGGPATVLTSSYTDPASLKNVLVGQLVALKLSVVFDASDANFGQSSVALGDMIIGSGTFKGQTVSQFLTIGEEVLGGCSSAYTPDQIVETATSINENFDNGTTNNGFLICPEDNGGGDDGGGGGDGGTPAA